MSGTAVFRGTRVPVQNLFDYLAGGETLEDFLEGVPDGFTGNGDRCIETSARIKIGVHPAQIVNPLRQKLSFSKSTQ
jgi:hypothetical protein